MTEDVAGMSRLFRQFSTPGGIPSHVGPTTPGSIHEGGELGYVLTHAFGAVFDNPELVAVAVVGDGEAETAPLEGSWKGIKFLNARATAPCCRFSISTATRSRARRSWAARPTSRSAACSKVTATTSTSSTAIDPMPVHRALATTLDTCVDEDPIDPGRRTHARRSAARRAGQRSCCARRRDGPARSSSTGLPVEGTFRAHQVPLAAVRTDPDQLAQLDSWMRSYHPEQLFDADGRLASRAARARADRRATNGRESARERRGTSHRPSTSRHRGVCARGRASRRRPARVDTRTRRAAARHLRQESNDLPAGLPDETNSNRLGAVFDVDTRCFQEPAIAIDDHVSAEGRVMEVLSEHNCQGWLEGYVLTGRHGLFATYEAFALVVASMATQHAKWLEMTERLPWRVAGAVAQLPADLDLLAQRPQRVLASRSRLHGHDHLEEGHGRARLSAARCQLPAVGRGPLPAQRELRQPHHHRQAAAAAVARPGRGARALRAGRVGLELGGYRRR